MQISSYLTLRSRDLTFSRLLRHPAADGEIIQHDWSPPQMMRMSLTQTALVYFPQKVNLQMTLTMKIQITTQTMTGLQLPSLARCSTHL